ncbi:hypothetical protein SLW70_08555 [Flavobacterium sp. NG2]|uniref:hypothetical protein n=1 Tax=Flavobacterium sp. NG2 TaxID=3097547 RepID=UPI002A7EECDB|nr:hypothetical protein [Flavobacterium sp. NG2]WPR73156.1 hypothetical protein SLW70_08555 [Flavobacterium sp. NG2]
MKQLFLKFHFFLIFSLLFSIQHKASNTIDFDAQYGVASGNILVKNITEAIHHATKGDVIYFKSKTYDFEGKSFTIDKGIVLCGIAPKVKQPHTIGAYEVVTAFKNLKAVRITTDDMGLENLRLQSDGSSAYVFTRFAHPSYGTGKNLGFYVNNHIKNVVYDGGGSQVYAENGAEVTFEQVSFLNYSNGGFNTNRKDPISTSAKAVFKKCTFVPNKDKVNYNVRGISADAGNDEYAEIWDQKGMVIDSCFFDGQGVAFSKCKNARITNNHFLGYRKDVDMIHIEEYSNAIYVANNTFEFISPSRCFFIDREGQPSYDISIVNNIFKGKYFWIFWSNGPTNLKFENNDLSQASASNPNDKTFDFNYQRTGDELPFPLPIEQLTIRNNKGLDNPEVGILSYTILKGDNTNLIEGFAPAKIQKKLVDEKPKSLLNTELVYQIKNKYSGEYLVAQKNDSKVVLTSNTKNDQSDLWKISFKYPYSYTFLNLKTKQYLEIEKGYTLGELTNPNLKPVFVEQKNAYLNKSLKPHFYLHELDGENKQAFQIAPGGNERKTRLVKKDNQVGIEVALEKLKFIPATKNSVWELVPVSNGYKK